MKHPSRNKHWLHPAHDGAARRAFVAGRLHSRHRRNRRFRTSFSDFSQCREVFNWGQIVLSTLRIQDFVRGDHATDAEDHRVRPGTVRPTALRNHRSPKATIDGSWAPTWRTSTNWRRI